MTPRQLREGSFPARLDPDEPPRWYAVIGGACLGIMATWAFFTLALGLPVCP
jgi:hypothetical protein